MGDDSSPTTDTEDEQREQIDVEPEEPASAGGGLLGLGLGQLLKFLGYMVLLGAAGEIGKQAVRRLVE